ncbi:MAG: ABC transporter ATP-binding protein, partial [Pseudomonadales bacterium]|nr:ABC transporter ATP-binding protein [Pseudomonadales bacterium]
MLGFFERLINPFPAEEPDQSPATLLAFCRHYARGMELPLILMSLLTAVLAVLEVFLFSFMGQLVDWLVTKDKATLLADEGTTLLWYSVLLLIIMPLLTFSHAAIIHQSLLGNFSMSIRWLSHRYLLKQNMDFYQNEFAGRIATKVMQTALAVR